MAKKSKSVDELEREFVLKAGAAFATERQKTLDSGLSVMFLRGRHVIKQTPDGKEEVVKRLRRWKLVGKGTVLQLDQ